ncbi:hypothetical protein ACPA2L_25700, partial [Bacillus bombysepticus]
ILTTSESVWRIQLKMYIFIQALMYIFKLAFIVPVFLLFFYPIFESSNNLPYYNFIIANKFKFVFVYLKKIPTSSLSLLKMEA